MNNAESPQIAVLSLLLIFPERADLIADAVKSEWMTGDYRHAFNLLIDGKGDVATLIGAGFDRSMVAEWIDHECMFTALDSHAKALEQNYLDRQLRQLGQQLLRTADNNERLVMLDSFNHTLVAKEEHHCSSFMEGCRSLAKELEHRYEHRGKLLGMTSGLNDLDAVTQGLHKGDLVVIAGASSMGKTSLALGMIESAAAQGHAALVFSCEMTTEQLLMRTVAAQSRVPLERVRSANFQVADWSRLQSAFGDVSQLPIEVNDSAGVSLADVERQVKRHKKQRGIEIVLIDYLQIMGYDKSNEQRELDRITTGLKNLAKSQDVCVVVLSQLNRQGQREDRAPSLIDLKGSGAIEANADVVLFPWRPGAACPLCLEKVETLEHSTSVHQCEAYAIVGKQRQGQRNIRVPLFWDGKYARFSNLAHVEEDCAA